MKLRTALLAAAIGGLAGPSFATPIAGSFNFTLGNFTANAVDIKNATMFTLPPTFNTFQGTGSFVTVPNPCTNCGTVGSTVALPAVPNTTPFSPTALFTIQGITVTLDSLLANTGTDGNQGTATAFSSRSIDANATFTDGNAADTATGTITLTLNSNGSGTGTLRTGSGGGSATATSATAVPEPMSLALLGGGLAALGVVRRRR